MFAHECQCLAPRLACDDCCFGCRYSRRWTSVMDRIVLPTHSFFSFSFLHTRCLLVCTELEKCASVSRMCCCHVEDNILKKIKQIRGSPLLEEDLPHR